VLLEGKAVSDTLAFPGTNDIAKIAYMQSSASFEF
jgi:hypothetical protein